MSKPKAEEKAVHPHYGVVVFVRTVSNTESVVRLASGVEQAVTTDWLTPVTIDDEPA